MYQYEYIPDKENRPSQNYIVIVITRQLYNQASKARGKKEEERDGDAQQEAQTIV